MISHPGKFITFEGSEGCGKSTQIAELSRSLEKAGRSVMVLREPGGTPIGEQIRHLLKFAREAEGMTAETELLLFAASRAQLVRKVIRPALNSGAVVICDRFRDSTTVYQGIARKIPPEQVEAINAFACGDCSPDATILLDMDPDKAMARALRRPRPVGGPRDRMEQEPPEFYRAVRDGYLKLADANPDRICIFNADQAAGDLAVEIQRFLTEKFHGIFTNGSI